MTDPSQDHHPERDNNKLMGMSVRLRLISRESAVGVELPAGEDQSDQVDEGSNPAVGGGLKGHDKSEISELADQSAG